MDVKHESQAEFARDMAALGLKDSTISNHQRPLNQWFDFLADRTGKPVGEVSLRRLIPKRIRPDSPITVHLPANAEIVEEFLSDYCRKVVDDGARGRRRNRARQSLRRFFHHQVITGKLVHDPTHYVRPARTARRVSCRQHLTRAEFRNLLLASFESGRDSERNAALVSTMGWSGIRPIEARNLTQRDLDLPRGIMGVFGKGEPRSAPVVDELALTLHRYLHTEYFLTISGGRLDAPLFPSSRTEEALTPKELLEIISGLGEAGGIRRRVTPYVLRHTFATTAYDDGVPLAVIARALGHKRLQNTYFYIHSIRKRMRTIAQQNPASEPLEQALSQLKQQGYYIQSCLPLTQAPR